MHTFQLTFKLKMMYCLFMLTGFSPLPVGKTPQGRELRFSPSFLSTVQSLHNYRLTLLPFTSTQFCQTLLFTYDNQRRSPMSQTRPNGGRSAVEEGGHTYPLYALFCYGKEAENTQNYAPCVEWLIACVGTPCPHLPPRVHTRPQ